MGSPLPSGRPRVWPEGLAVDREDLIWAAAYVRGLARAVADYADQHWRIWDMQHPHDRPTNEDLARFRTEAERLAHRDQCRHADRAVAIFRQGSGPSS